MISHNGLVQLGFKPHIDFILEDRGAGVVMIWKSGSPEPSVADIEAAEVQWNAKDYARTREMAYPSIGDQLDMLWHAIDTGDWTAAKVKTTSFYTELKAVKDANPKP